MSAPLAIHIAGGGTAILTGAVALAARKGGRLHRAAGQFFTAAMLVMATAATLLAFQLQDWPNLPGGLFAFYLVLTGWAALARNRGRAARANEAGLVIGGASASAALLLAVQANATASGTIAGKPAAMFAFVAGLATFAICLDLSIMRHGHPTRIRSLARHIWRMCTALFIGTGSFFLGQQKVLPDRLQGSPSLVALALAPLLLMVIWLARIAVWKRPPATGSEAASG